MDKSGFDTPLDDARKYVASLERRTVWLPILLAGLLLAATVWYDLGEARTPTILLGALIIGLWREVLDARAQMARSTYIWMRSRREIYDARD